MRVRPTSLSPLAAALALGVAAALLAAGCGKSLPRESAAARGAGVTTVSGGTTLAAGGLATKNTTRLGGASPIADAAAVALAVNPGLTPTTRPQAVVLVNDRDWPAALAAAALASAPIGAPLLYSEGNTLPALSSAALAALHPRGAPTLGGAQVVEVDTSAAPAAYRTHPVQAGQNETGQNEGPAGRGVARGDTTTGGGGTTTGKALSRAHAIGPSTTTTTTTPTPPSGSPAAPTRETATAAAANEAAAERSAQIERILAQARHSRPHSVIVIGADGPQALAMPAAGLAAETGAPILPVGATTVPPATRRVLKQLRRPAIYAVGPAAAVSEAVLAKLGRFGTVRRIDAETVTGAEAGARGGGCTSGSAAAGSAAAGNTPAGSAAAGNTAAGGEAVANSIAVARYGDGAFGWDVEEPGHGLVFADSSRPLDAPAAAPLSASGDFGPLLLLEGPGAVPGALAEYLCEIQPRYPEYEPARGFYNHGWLIGDESAIAVETQAELDAMLETAPRAASEATGTTTGTTGTTGTTPGSAATTPEATSGAATRG